MMNDRASMVSATIGTVEAGATVGTVEAGATIGTVEADATIGTVEAGAGFVEGIVATIKSRSGMMEPSSGVCITLSLPPRQPPDALATQPHGRDLVSGLQSVLGTTISPGLAESVDSDASVECGLGYRHSDLHGHHLRVV